MCGAIECCNWAIQSASRGHLASLTLRIHYITTLHCTGIRGINSKAATNSISVLVKKTNEKHRFSNCKIKTNQEKRNSTNLLQTISLPIHKSVQAIRISTKNPWRLTGKIRRSDTKALSSTIKAKSFQVRNMSLLKLKGQAKLIANVSQIHRTRITTQIPAISIFIAQPLIDLLIPNR